MRQGRAPRLDAEGLYDVLPGDHRLPYRMEDILDCILDAGDFLEFQPEHAPEFLCAAARLNGRNIGVIANRRGFLKTSIRTSRRWYCLYGIGEKSGVFRRKCATASLAAAIRAGRLGLHGRGGGGNGGHYSRRRGDGGDDGVRDGSQDCVDREPRERRGILRDGGPGVRPDISRSVGLRRGLA